MKIQKKAALSKIRWRRRSREVLTRRIKRIHIRRVRERRKKRWMIPMKNAQKMKNMRKTEKVVQTLKRKKVLRRKDILLIQLQEHMNLTVEGMKKMRKTIRKMMQLINTLKEINILIRTAILIQIDIPIQISILTKRTVIQINILIEVKNLVKKWTALQKSVKKKNKRKNDEVSF